MGNEKINATELKDEELEQVSGGEWTTDYVIKATKEEKVENEIITESINSENSIKEENTSDKNKENESNEIQCDEEKVLEESNDNLASESVEENIEETELNPNGWGSAFRRRSVVLGMVT